jgi:hypothetical protein
MLKVLSAFLPNVNQNSFPLVFCAFMEKALNKIAAIKKDNFFIILFLCKGTENMFTFAQLI